MAIELLVGWREARWWAKALACALFALPFTSCSRVFVVSPVGALASGVAFEFSEVSGERSSFRIQELVVYSIAEDGSSSPI